MIWNYFIKYFLFFGERIIFSPSSQPWPNNQHFNAYDKYQYTLYIHIRACFFTWGKARGVPDAVSVSIVTGTTILATLQINNRYSTFLATLQIYLFICRVVRMAEYIYIYMVRADRHFWLLLQVVTIGICISFCFCKYLHHQRWRSWRESLNKSIYE